MQLSTTIRLRPDQYKRLKALRDETGVPASVLIKAALDAFFALTPEQRAEAVEFQPASGRWSGKK